jgi:hypothetical protein
LRERNRVGSVAQRWGDEEPYRQGSWLVTSTKWIQHMPDCRSINAKRRRNIRDLTVNGNRYSDALIAFLRICLRCSGELNLMNSFVRN